jgi:hypothetical protein
MKKGFLIYEEMHKYFTIRPLVIVLLPENLRAYFELSAQAWILYKWSNAEVGRNNFILILMYL